MSTSSLDDTAMTSSSDVTRDVNQVLRLNGAKSRHFAFRWKQRNNDEINTSKKLTVKDLSTDNLSSSKISNGFLKNIKKRLHIRNLGLCRVQQKIKEIDSQQLGTGVAQVSPSDEKSLSSISEKTSISSNERVISANCENASEDSSSNSRVQDFYVSAWEREYSTLTNDETLGEPRIDRGGQNEKRNGENERDDFATPTEGGNIAEPQSTRAKESVETVDNIIDAQISYENKAKVNLSEELLKLSKYGWYWGPISGDEADSKLVSEPDGAFLVRDSSDDRYLLTLSFKSSGRLLHARMEHSGGLFSLCNQSVNEGFTSVAALIDHSMNSSQSAVFCYSRPKYPGYPSFPVRLTKPVSRFTQVRSLQYLCRFVIRQNTRLDNIHKLPLPKTIRGYIEEAHY